MFMLFTSPVIMMKCPIVAKLLFVHETRLAVTLECVSCLNARIWDERKASLRSPSKPPFSPVTIKT